MRRVEESRLQESRALQMRIGFVFGKSWIILTTDCVSPAAGSVFSWGRGASGLNSHPRRLDSIIQKSLDVVFRSGPIARGATKESW